MKNRNQNYHKILRVLYDMNELTRYDIAQQTGVSIPTVAKNIDELIKDGFVIHSGVATSTGGRRPDLFTINRNSRYSLGVDISPGRVRIILTNIKLEILERRECKIQSEDSFNHIMNLVKIESNNMIKKNKIELDSLLGIGISVHGILNKNRTILLVAPNMGLKNVDFRKYTKFFPYKMFVENEANCGVLGEKFFLKRDDSRNLVFISINEGLGSGVIIDEKLFNGVNKRAGEFGHMKIGDQGRKCGCRGKDCWETYCSEIALLNSYSSMTGNKLNNLDDIFRLYKSGDEKAVAIIDEFLEYLAYGIRNVILIMDPNTVIVGGKIAKYKDILMTPLKRKVFQNCNLYSKDDIQLIFSILHEDASIIGAALMPINKVLKWTGNLHR